MRFFESLAIGVAMYSKIPMPRVDWTALLSGLKTPVRDDSTVAEKLYAQAEALCKGEKTMDEAVTGAKTELATYLTEKRA